MLMVNPSYGFDMDVCAYADTNLALVTGQLSKEITDAGDEIEKLFGFLNEELLQLR